MRHTITALFAMGALLSGVASAADYWPMQDGLVWRYGAGTASDNEFTMACVDSSCGRGYEWIVGQYGSSQRSEFRTTAEGDIVLAGSMYWSTGALDPDIQTFDPPLTFLDLPLEVGKQWVSMSGSAVLIGQVTGESAVDTPAGSFNVLIVSINDLFGQTWLGGTYYLERSIGPVMYGELGLSYFNGTVETVEASWGGIKCLYR